MEADFSVADRLTTTSPRATHCQLRIEPQKSPGRYRCTFRALDGPKVEDQLDMGGPTYVSGKLRQDMISLAIGKVAGLLKRPEVGVLPAPRRIELYLPPDPIASIDWEALDPRFTVIRRPLTEPSYRVGARLPEGIKWGIVSLLGKQESAEELRRRIGLYVPSSIHVAVFAPPASLEELITIVQSERCEGLHILLKAEASSAGPVVHFRRKVMPLDEFVPTLAGSGLRATILQAVGRDGLSQIAALRQAGQRLPADSNTTLVLCASASRALTKSLYQGFYSDESLDMSLSQAIQGKSRGFHYSVIANEGIDTALKLRQALYIAEPYARQLRDSSLSLLAGVEQRALNAIDRQLLTTVADEISSELGAASTQSMIDKVVQVSRLTEAAEQSLRPLVQKLDETTVDRPDQPPNHDPRSQGRPWVPNETIIERLDQPRYPAAAFYIIGEEGTQIPKTQTLSQLPIGMSLEFRFWLDTVETGIAYIGDRPAFTPPNTSAYPIHLSVDVWSQDFKFAVTSCFLTLEQQGRTKQARFPLRLLTEGPEADLFVFLRYEGDLLAAFRVSAIVTASSQEQPDAQSLEHAYLATDWFRFENRPAGGTALTVFVTKKNDNLQVFTLPPSGPAWGKLGRDVSEFRQVNQDVYRHLHKLALDAEKVRSEQKALGWEQGATQLAGIGSRLLSELFYITGEQEIQDFVNRYLKQLPVGSRVTIALNEKSRDLMIPWGLLYNGLAPAASGRTGEVADRNGFWGMRFNLAVRPSLAIKSQEPAGQYPVRVGAAWLDRHESRQLAKFYSDQQRTGKVRIERLRAEHQSIPDLATKEFDLLHFYCHAHTYLPGATIDGILLEDYRGYVQGTVPQEQSARQLLMRLEEESALGSFVYLDGGIATLTALAQTVSSRPGLQTRPIVLLSMCESAQVSCSGAGFVTFFLARGARAIIGTEGPTLWSLAREMDEGIVGLLVEGKTIDEAFNTVRRQLAETNVLALIYSLFGERDARLVDVGAAR